MAEQTEQCLRNIQSALEQAGASLRDVVRVRYILPKADAAGLADPRIRIEIEVTARRSTT